MVLRVSAPAPRVDAAAIETFLPGTHATAPDPTYGTQMRDFSLPGHGSEYRLQVPYEEIEVPLSGGQVATLREPTCTAADLLYGPLHDKAMLNPRVAPQMIGLGLLEAIPTQDILAWADPEDADGDGISGRTQVVRSDVHGRPMLGRFSA